MKWCWEPCRAWECLAVHTVKLSDQLPVCFQQGLTTVLLDHCQSRGGGIAQARAVPGGQLGVGHMPFLACLALEKYVESWLKDH